MTRQQAPDLAAALAMPRRRSAPPPMPSVGLKLRLKTSPSVRRALPSRLVVARAVRKGQASWKHSPAERSDALSAMETIVARTARAAELTGIAHAHLIEREAESAVFWQPWPTPSLDARSGAVLEQALAGGRGLLFSAPHQGPHYLAMGAVASLGHFPFAVGGPWFFEAPTPDYWGRRLARWWRGGKSRLICSTGSYPILQALLERDELLFLLFDLPGPHETDFLGKRVWLADGTARLAVQTDTPVLPLRVRRVGHRAAMDVAPPLDPRDCTDVEELHAALAKVHEDWILESPEAMEDPRKFGWGDSAAPDAWVRPPKVPG